MSPPRTSTLGVDMSKVATLPATEQAALLRQRQMKSEELLDTFVDRIERLDETINAVCTLAVDQARAACRQADEDAAHGKWRGPLHGLPITVKDAIETAGIRSTGG